MKLKLKLTFSSVSNSLSNHSNPPTHRFRLLIPHLRPIKINPHNPARVILVIKNHHIPRMKIIVQNPRFMNFANRINESLCARLGVCVEPEQPHPGDVFEDYGVGWGGGGGYFSFWNEGGWSTILWRRCFRLSRGILVRCRFCWCCGLLGGCRLWLRRCGCWFRGGCIWGLGLGCGAVYPCILVFFPFIPYIYMYIYKMKIVLDSPLSRHIHVPGYSQVIPGNTRKISTLPSTTTSDGFTLVNHIILWNYDHC